MPSLVTLSSCKAFLTTCALSDSTVCPGPAGTKAASTSVQSHTVSCWHRYGMTLSEICMLS
jgi:hypothetical protein